MSVILLSNAYYVERAAGASFMHPYSVDFRNGCLLETFPKSRRSYKCAFVKMRVRRFVGSGTSQNRIIAIHHPLDSEDGLFNFAAGVISRPFPKRSFEAFFVVTKFAFKDNFRIRGNGQP